MQKIKNKRAFESGELWLFWLFPESPATEWVMWGKVQFLIQAPGVAADILSCLRRGPVTQSQSLPGLILAALLKHGLRGRASASSSKWDVSSFALLNSCWRWSRQLRQEKNNSQCCLLLLWTPEQRSRAFTTWKSGLNINKWNKASRDQLGLKLCSCPHWSLFHYPVVLYFLLVEGKTCSQSKSVPSDMRSTNLIC